MSGVRILGYFGSRGEIFWPREWEFRVSGVRILGLGGNNFGRREKNLGPRGQEFWASGVRILGLGSNDFASD